MLCITCVRTTKNDENGFHLQICVCFLLLSFSICALVFRSPLGLAPSQHLVSFFVLLLQSTTSCYLALFLSLFLYVVLHGCAATGNKLPDSKGISVWVFLILILKHMFFLYLWCKIVLSFSAMGHEECLLLIYPTCCAVAFFLSVIYATYCALPCIIQHKVARWVSATHALKWRL